MQGRDAGLPGCPSNCSTLQACAVLQHAPAVGCSGLPADSVMVTSQASASAKLHHLLDRGTARPSLHGLCCRLEHGLRQPYCGFLWFCCCTICCHLLADLLRSMLQAAAPKVCIPACFLLPNTFAYFAEPEAKHDGNVRLVFPHDAHG